MCITAGNNFSYKALLRSLHQPDINNNKPVPHKLKYLQYVDEPQLTKSASSHLESLKCTGPLAFGILGGLYVLH